jgi:hypothetical protein
MGRRFEVGGVAVRTSLETHHARLRRVADEAGTSAPERQDALARAARVANEIADILEPADLLLSAHWIVIAAEDRMRAHELAS